MPPSLSVVVLTWNEARNIGPALRALARQRERDFEVIVIDAASTDGTVPAIEAERPNMPMPLRLVVAGSRIPIGEARNKGAALAQAPAIAFLSADAEVDERWTAEALRSLQSADLVFSRQVHAPHEWSVGAAVRGLRYHFPTHDGDDPMRYASNVAAAYKREVVQRFPFDPWANAAEDLLLAQRAAASGFRVAYNPWMVVHHHDVATAKVEWRKNVREGHGWALYADEIGHLRSLLAWGGLLAGTLGIAVAGAVVHSPWLLAGGALALLGALYLPAVRRGWKHRKDTPRRALVKGVACSPPFDLAFLVNYLRGLAQRRGRKAAPTEASVRNDSPMVPRTPVLDQEPPA